jgi:nucleoside-diphosphate-sugar epimerase
MLEGVTRVVHAAALMSFWRRDHAKMYHANVEGTRNLVDKCLRAKIEKFVYIGAMAAVGAPADRTTRLVNEETPTVRKKSGVFYSETKEIAGRIVEGAARVGLPAVTLVPPMIIGPGNWEESSAAVFRLIHDGMPFYLASKVPAVAAVDVARAVRLALDGDYRSGERFFLVAATLGGRELFEKMARSLGKSAPKVRAPRFAVMAISFLAELISYITWKKPQMTVEGIRMISDNPPYKFDGGKICRSFDFRYTPIDEAIAETGRRFLEDLGAKGGA